MTRFWPFASRLLVLAAGLLIVFGIVRWINHPSLGAGWQPSGEVYWVRPQSPAAAVLDTSTRLLAIDGAAVGELSSAGWGYAAGRCVGLATLRGAAANQVHAGTPLAVDLWGEAVGATAWDAWPPKPAA